jgi:hypothetical protein
MELTYTCPDCDHTARHADVEHATVTHCASCHQTRDLRAPLNGQSQATSCPWCATSDLYIQKDFPHGLGLAIVFLGFAISTIFWYYYKPLSALAVLLATALLDGVLYHLVPDVTICYRCASQLRGPGSNPAKRFKPFDLAIGERYRQERLRLEELRKARPATVHAADSSRLPG